MEHSYSVSPKVKFLKGLDETGIQYAILHGWKRMLKEPQQDVDLVIASADLQKFKHYLVHWKVVQVYNYEAHSWGFILVTENGTESIIVDISTDYRWAGRIFFAENDLLQNRRRWNNFWILTPERELAFLLVKKIYEKGSIPDHQRLRLKELLEELGEPGINIASELLGAKWSDKVAKWIKEGNSTELETHIWQLRNALRSQLLRRDPLNGVYYWLLEFRRIWLRWLYPTGLWVAALGPDGAGKSTLICNLQEQLNGVFRRTAVFHWNPGIIRRRPAGMPVVAPHGKPPRSFLTSLVKIPYYVHNYLLGYLLRVRPKLAMSTLVLFDRHYDDLLVDPRRYRYAGPRWLPRLFRGVIPRPHIFFVLNVPEDKLLSRKREVSREEVCRQRKEYLKLAAELPIAMVVDGSLSPEDVARQAKDVILDFLHERYLKRRHLWFGRKVEPQREWSKWTEEGGNGAKENKSAKFLEVTLPGQRKYLIPATSRRVAPKTLSIYNAQGIRGRIGKTLLAAGLRLGVAQPFLREVKWQYDELEMLGLLCGIFGRSDITFAVSLGTPGVHQKPVLQIITRSGEVIGYAKIGWNAISRELVCNEARVLAEMAEWSGAFRIPKVLFAGNLGSLKVCVQSPPCGKIARAPTILTSGYINSVTDLTERTGVVKRLQSSLFWEQLEGKVKAMKNVYYRSVAERYLRSIAQHLDGRPVLFHRAHGDFCPWNALWVGERPYLFDWEYSREMPAGYDIFHFLTQTKSLLGNRALPDVIRWVRGQGETTIGDGYRRCRGAEPEIAHDLLLLYVLDQLSSCGSSDSPWFSNLRLVSALVNMSTDHIL